MVSRSLDPSIKLFISDHQSIHVAAVGPHDAPTLVRGLGCRVSVEDGRIRLLINREQAEVLLQAVRASGKVAAVFSQPDNHKTLQLKGEDGRVEAPDATDRQLHKTYIKRFAQRLHPLGIDALFVQTLCNCASESLAVVTFTPLRTFEQTPGGNAGDLLPVGGVLP